jgi:hypothetical protein
MTLANVYQGKESGAKGWHYRYKKQGEHTSSARFKLGSPFWTLRIPTEPSSSRNLLA